MGHTLLLDLPQEVYESLVETAQQTGQTPEAVAMQWLVNAAQAPLDDPLEPFIGAFDSGGLDWADRHDEYLGKAIWDSINDTDDDDNPST